MYDTTGKRIETTFWDCFSNVTDSNVPKIILALGLVQTCKINIWEMFGVITDAHF